MSKNNQFILIQPPMFPDGYRVEKMESPGHRCPSCSGNGWFWGLGKRNEKVKETCTHCGGSGKLDATIIIEWKPAK